MRFPIYAVALLLSACGGGGGSISPPVTPAAFALSAITPANNSLAGNDAAPTITFNAAPDKTTITASSISLSSPIGTVESTLTLNGNSVAVTPSHPLVWGTHYQLTVSDAVRSSTGDKLSAASTTGFDTRAPAWSTSAAIPSTTASNVQTYGLKTVSAPNGDAMTAWMSKGFNASTGKLMIVHYTASTLSWSTPTTLPNNTLVSLDTDRSIAIDLNATGKGAAAWGDLQSDGTYIIKASRLDATGNWIAPMSLTSADSFGSGGSPQVAVSQNGNVVVTWMKAINSTYTIYAAYYDASSQQWSAPSAVSTTSTTMVNNAIAGIDTNGTAIVLWSDGSGNGMGISAKRYDAAAKSWGTVSHLEDATGGSQATPTDATFDANGNATAEWITYFDYTSHSSSSKVGTAHYNAATGAWSQAVYSETTTHSTIPPVTTPLPSQNANLPPPPASSTDAAGNGWITWVGGDGSTNNISVMRYNATTGKWDAPQVITSQAVYMANPVLALDQTGQVILVWEQHTGNSLSDSYLAYSRLTGH